MYQGNHQPAPPASSSLDLGGSQDAEHAEVWGRGVSLATVHPLLRLSENQGTPKPISEGLSRRNGRQERQ